MALADELEPADGELLRASHLSKRFGGVIAVDDCSLIVARGSITGLIGPNGSGKTTLFNMITGLAKPDLGSVTFAGQSITGLRPDQIHRRGIGRTFQLARIFPRLTVFENMLVPLSRKGLQDALTASHSSIENDRVHEMLEFLGLTRLANQPAGRLSYGQRKLLEFGAVVICRPTLAMLDEPAGGVNPGLLEFISEHITMLNNKGMTFLVVDHDMPFVMKLCSTVTVLAGGRVIASGHPDAIRADPAVLDAYLGD
jgi:ABC-type branched-subunit amino acid transport system ATPase component